MLVLTCLGTLLAPSHVLRCHKGTTMSALLLDPAVPSTRGIIVVQIRSEGIKIRCIATRALSQMELSIVAKDVSQHHLDKIITVRHS
jgi:hypothetical protein